MRYLISVLIAIGNPPIDFTHLLDAISQRQAHKHKVFALFLSFWMVEVDVICEHGPPSTQKGSSHRE